MKNEIQLRGNCQVCGREQAVKKGFIVNHGYTVGDGFFSGICPGTNFKPMQTDTKQTDNTVEIFKARANNELHQAEQLEKGENFPEKIPENNHYKARLLPFNEVSKHYQEYFISQLIAKSKRMAENYFSASKSLKQLADSVYGKPLKEVKKPTPPEPIEMGETRTYKGKTYVVCGFKTRNVIYQCENGKKFVCSTRMWRTWEKM